MSMCKFLFVNHPPPLCSNRRFRCVCAWIAFVQCFFLHACRKLCDSLSLHSTVHWPTPFPLLRLLLFVNQRLLCIYQTKTQKCMQRVKMNANETLRRNTMVCYHFIEASSWIFCTFLSVARLFFAFVLYPKSFKFGLTASVNFNYGHTTQYGWYCAISLRSHTHQLHLAYLTWHLHRW